MLNNKIAKGNKNLVVADLVLAMPARPLVTLLPDKLPFGTAHIASAILLRVDVLARVAVLALVS